MIPLDEYVNEALLDPKKLNFVACEVKQGKIKYCTAVGGIFTIKKIKYAKQVQQNLIELGVKISNGVETAQKVIKQASTKLIWIIYPKGDISEAMICNSDILVPLDKSIKLR